MSPMKRERPPFYSKTIPIVEGIKKVFADPEYKPPLTVRMLYYQLSTKMGLVPFDENGSTKGYDKTQYITLRMRQLGILRWDWFADRARQVDGRHNLFADMSDYWDRVKDIYRRDLWEEQNCRVEIWLEKDALQGFFMDALGPYRVGLYTIRGFSSKTFIYEAAQVIKNEDKPTHIYYFGDHDPSGLAIEDDLLETLDLFGASVASFQRVAVDLDDIERFGLRALPVKRGDSRAPKYIKRFGTVTVELDALPPKELRRRIVECVDRHIDHEAWSRLRQVEEAEQETIRDIAERMGGAK
jgi:hypothetical protein